MTDFKIIPPKQKYMSLAEIDKLFGARGVVAYDCKVKDGTPMGGYVIAVQNAPGAGSAGIKKYMRQFKTKFPGKEPIYYIRLEQGETDKHWTITYDNGGKESTALPALEVKKSAAEKAMDKVPDKFIAEAIRTGLFMDR